MAKAKTSQTMNSDPGGLPLPPRNQHLPTRRDLLLILMPVVALVTSVYIWISNPDLPATALAMIGGVWLITGVAVLGRLQSRRMVCELQAMINREQMINARLEPSIADEPTGLRMRYVSAWLVAALGVAAAAVLWHAGPLESSVGGVSTLVVGAAVSAMLALSVAANTINRLKARRLARDFRAAMESERFALETLNSLDVMFSSCLPTGERTRFSDRFLHLTGCTEAQLQGRGWLEIVHPDDRDAVLELIDRPLTRKQSRHHEMCVRDKNGNYAWLHETLAPRTDEHGNLLEFICTAVNITPFVENETALEKQISDLTKSLTDANVKIDEMKGEFSKTKTARNRLEKNLEEAKDEVNNLQSALDKAEAQLEKAKTEAAEKISDIRAEAKQRVNEAQREAESQLTKLDDALRSARQELQQTSTENKKLARAFEKMQGELGEVRQENGDLREQLARQIKETREAREEAADARKLESQLRARSERSTERTAELEEMLAERDAALAEARDHAEQTHAAAAGEIERRVSERSAEALASHLRSHLNGVQRMTAELLAYGLDGPLQDAANNAAASIGAMSDLVDEAIGGDDRPAAKSSRKKRDVAQAFASQRAGSFDLRRTAQGVIELLQSEADLRGVAIEVEFATNLPAIVHGDDIELRTAMLTIMQATLAMVKDGALKLRLSEDINTGAHSTIRCELRHGSARIKADALEEALALSSTDREMPEPSAHPLTHAAAKAWQTIRSLQGQHGFMLPDTGGFLLWFTFALGRPAASAWMRDEPAYQPQTPDGAHLFAPIPSQTNRSPINAIGEAAESAASGEPSSGRMPRMPQEYLECNLGEVIELGGDSIRILASRKPRRSQVEVTFGDVDPDMKLRAEVAWCKKAGRKQDLGLKFLDVTPELKQAILQIAMQHRKTAVMGET